MGDEESNVEEKRVGADDANDEESTVDEKRVGADNSNDEESNVDGKRVGAMKEPEQKVSLVDLVATTVQTDMVDEMTTVMSMETKEKTEDNQPQVDAETKEENQDES